MPAHWLVKQEPAAYAFSHLVRDRRTTWDGVRNPEARKNLAAMAPGDDVLYYHTGDEKAVVGSARVTRAAFPDPADPAWVAVEIEAVAALAAPVTLQEMRQDPALADFVLLRRPRLSVVPVTGDQFRRIVALGQRRG